MTSIINNSIFTSAEIYCLFSTTVQFSHLFGNLTLTLMEELLQSTTTEISKAFIIASDGNVFHGDLANEANIYTQKVQLAYVLPTVATPTDIWFNKVPCRACVNSIIQIFADRGLKPTLHIETLNFSENKIEKLMSSMGCLARLQSQGFPIQTWNWGTFENYLSETVNCKNRISTYTTASEYVEKKAVFEEFMQIYNALCSSNAIEDWCE